MPLPPFFQAHWLKYKQPTGGGWVYVCGCKDVFKAGFEDDAQRMFHQHLDAARRARQRRREEIRRGRR